MHVLASNQRAGAVGRGYVEEMDAEADKAVECYVDRIVFAGCHWAADSKHRMSCMDLTLMILVLRKTAEVGSPTSKTSVESRSGPFRTAKMAS